MLSRGVGENAQERSRCSQCLLVALELVNEETLPAACCRSDHSPLMSLNAHIRLHRVSLLYLLGLSQLFP